MAGINWWRLEQRKPPSAQDIAKAVKAAKKLPDAGDHGHVMPPWDMASEIPATQEGDWEKSKTKTVKIKKLKATTARLKRDDLIWHIQNPGKSRFQGQFNTHPQVVKSNGDLTIADGHHRLAALLMLGVTKEQAWVLKQK